MTQPRDTKTPPSLTESDVDRHAEEYARIMEPVISGDIPSLELLAESVDGFPAGQDPWLNRHWITNAIDCGSASAVRWMLERNAPVVFRDSEGYTVLHSAIEREEDDKYEVMSMLIEFGADVNAHGTQDWTPSHMAAVRNDLQALRLLHQAGGDFSIRTRIDMHATVLEEARQAQCSPEVLAFLESPAGDG